MSHETESFDPSAFVQDVLVPGQLGPIMTEDAIRESLIFMRSHAAAGTDSEGAIQRTALTQEQVVESIAWPANKLSRLESGARPPTLKDVLRLMSYYGALDIECDETKRRLEDVAALRKLQKARYGKDFPETELRYTEHENRSNLIETYAGLLVPSLLRTERYNHAISMATASFNSEGVAPDRLERLRQDRMARLLGPHGPVMQIILSQSVLLSAVGGQEVSDPQQKYDVMSEQVDRLIAYHTATNDGGLGLNPHVTIRVNPFLHGYHSPFSLRGYTIARYWDIDPINPSGPAARSWIYTGEPGAKLERFDRGSVIEADFDTGFQDLARHIPGPDETVGILEAIKAEYLDRL